ncbi:hypothetical protein B9J78_06745 [bacterium Unc6]|nr:hypothetical protein [bacterium Unc6]
MSRQIALDIINLKSAQRLGHTDYSMEYHDEYIRKITGLEKDHPDAMKKFYDAWEYDFLWNTDDGLYGNWLERGRATDMGHAVYADDSSDKKQAQECPFKTQDDVWSFDPIKEYGLPDFKEQVTEYERLNREKREKFSNQLVTGGYYKTIISGAIQSFGWDMLLMAAADADKFEKVLDRFFKFTLHYMKAWAETSVEVVIQHDDFVWTSGAFIHPDFYRKAIIPRYAELWKPLHKAGKKVLFCSDGNFIEFAGDVVKAGADGLIFEPVNDFEFMVERFGDSVCLVGSSVDCRDMTFGKWDKVKADIDKTLKLAKKCKAVIFAVGNHIPANIPDDMCQLYIDYLKKNWFRKI